MTTGWKRFIWAGTILSLIIGIYGCGDLFSYRSIREREPEKKQPTATSYRFEDIPLPAGMTLNRKESFIYETRTIRTGLLVYEGKGEMEKLSSFFKEQMPNYQWRLLSNFELHNVMLTFIKEGWNSVIYIQPQEDETKRIEIRVGPVETQRIPIAK